MASALPSVLVFGRCPCRSFLAPPPDIAGGKGAQPEEGLAQKEKHGSLLPEGSSGAEETAKDKRSGLGWLRPGPSEGDRTAAAAEEGGEAKRVVLDEAMERQVDEELDLVEAEQKNSAWKALRQRVAGLGKRGHHACIICGCAAVTLCRFQFPLLPLYFNSVGPMLRRTVQATALVEDLNENRCAEIVTIRGPSTPFSGKRQIILSSYGVLSRSGTLPWPMITTTGCLLTT